MASKKIATAVELPECPVCLNEMKAPIFQCQSGHSLCHSCTSVLCPPVCPICRQAMTQMRNWQLEEIISKAKLPCPNASLGCVYTITLENDSHVKECIFRKMECPFGAVFGKCSWNGTVKEMSDHFKERHPKNCEFSADAEIVLNNVNLNEDDRYFYLTALGKLLFIVTFKIDTIEKMAYWTVQHIGAKALAGQHVYEIHVSSRADDRRTVVFTEHCFNDTMKVEEIFKLGKCGIMPLSMLKNFIKANTMAFKFSIKKYSPEPKGKGKAESSEQGNNESKQKGPQNQGNNAPKSGFKGKPGPKGPAFKGPGPSGPGPKASGPKVAGDKAPKQQTNPFL